MPELIARAKFRCLGQLHQIGVTTTGQLVFYHHTKKELGKQEAAATLGAEPCRCAQIRQIWRGQASGELPDGLQAAFAAVCNAKGSDYRNGFIAKHAARIVRRLNAIRARRTERVPVAFDHLAFIGLGAGEARRNLYRELRDRGLPIRLLPADYGGSERIVFVDPAKEAANAHTALGAVRDGEVAAAVIQSHSRAVGPKTADYTRRKTSSHLTVEANKVEISVTKDRLGMVPVAFLADLAERAYRASQLAAARERCHGEARKAFPAKVDADEARFIAGVVSASATGNEQHWTASLNLSVSLLTPQAVSRIIDELNKVLPKLHRIAAAGQIRAKNPHRFPSPPQPWFPKRADTTARPARYNEYGSIDQPEEDDGEQQAESQEDSPEPAGEEAPEVS